MIVEDDRIILFVGDYIRLINNYYGADSKFYRVDSILTYDVLLLENGVYVPARVDYIAEVLSAKQYEEMME
jgi:hypothetical protein